MLVAESAAPSEHSERIYRKCRLCDSVLLFSFYLADSSLSVITAALLIWGLSAAFTVCLLSASAEKSSMFSLHFSDVMTSLRHTSHLTVRVKFSLQPRQIQQPFSVSVSLSLSLSTNHKAAGAQHGRQGAAAMHSVGNTEHYACCCWEVTACPASENCIHNEGLPVNTQKVSSLGVTFRSSKAGR